jgi:hypothetical protein
VGGRNWARISCHSSLRRFRRLGRRGHRGLRGRGQAS